MSTFRVIVGLGNPGAKYAMTRHNAGFWFVDELARRLGSGGSWNAEKRFHGELFKLSTSASETLLLKPNTFMNRSGTAVQAIMSFYKVAPQDILIAHDEIDLPPGTVKLKRSGGHGGNNGLRDTIATIGKDFARLRIGVGHPGHKDQVVSYVLNRPNAEQEPHINSAIERAVDCFDLMQSDGLEAAMLPLHSGNSNLSSGT